jgi:hypothetical protein
MRALTVAPSVANLARVEDVPESAGAVLVGSLAVCVTDREIVSGVHGWAPPGAKRLVIGQKLPGRATLVGSGAQRSADAGAARR